MNLREIKIYTVYAMNLCNEISMNEVSEFMQ